MKKISYTHKNPEYKPYTKTNIKRISLSAVLCALALIIFTVEAQIPAFIPIPGVKLGLSNAVTLFSLLYLTPYEAFSILIGRIILGGIFSANPSVIIYSLSGGILSLSGELILFGISNRSNLRKKSIKKTITEISIIGGMLHNVGQVLCASVILHTASVFYYLPPLLIIGAITGALCGICVLGIDKKVGSDIINLLKNNR